MQYSPHPTRSVKKYLRKPTQQGFVLVTAVIFLIVLSLLTVMAMRSSLFEERFASNDRDLAVARENAELALRDAERDILGFRFDGQYCAAVPCTTLRPAGFRPVNAADAGNFWIATAPVVEFVASTDGGRLLTTPFQGVYTADSTTACGMPIWSGANWNDGVTRTCLLGSTIGTNALPTIAYGTFTDAPFAQQGVIPPRYLIEMFLPTETVPGTSSSKILFRITAVGFGRTIGSNGARTSVTLQSTFSAL
jgi:type IV pilus assembly protein PilX